MSQKISYRIEFALNILLDYHDVKMKPWQPTNSRIVGLLFESLHDRETVAHQADRARVVNQEPAENQDPWVPRETTETMDDR